MIPAHPGLRGGPVYLDYNATTRVDPRVVDAMLPHLVRHSLRAARMEPVDARRAPS